MGMKRVYSLLSFLALLLASSISNAASPSDVGIVLLHGKGGGPTFQVLVDFASEMTGRGYKVKTPKLPWSGKKGKAEYTGSLDDTFEIIKGEIASLRQSGREKIVLVGHSMGTAGAIAFVSTSPSVEGLIGIAPGHFPGSDFHNKFVFFDVKRAREMVFNGNGDRTLKVEDYNSGGRRFEMEVVAKNYLSLFDPKGPMNFGSNMKKLGETPLLWVAPDSDPVTTQGWAKDYFSMAPKNPKSKYIEINAEHINAPVKGVEVIHKWISEL
jgi:pimeloyl-ACP methyl ester carboxylesterase